jgi:hypothetical protein
MSKRWTSTIILLLGFFAVAAAASTIASAERAFTKIISMTGEWEGKDDHGMPVKSIIKVIAGNTAVMETLSVHGMEEMVTIYSLDGNAISLIHYCPTNNQPHMQAIPPNEPFHELVFDFTNARNLPSLTKGHEQKLILRFEDADHIQEVWTWRRDGKDTQMTIDLARKKLSLAQQE